MKLTQLGAFSVSSCSARAELQPHSHTLQGSQGRSCSHQTQPGEAAAREEKSSGGMVSAGGDNCQGTGDLGGAAEEEEEGGAGRGWSSPQHQGEAATAQEHQEHNGVKP